MNKQFLDAIFTDSIQHPNFFNGRILNATDLQEEQKANQKRSRYLAQATGTGVAYGLGVTANNASNLLISGGLAINPRGDALVLPESTTIPLQTTKKAALPNENSPFAPCDLAGVTTVTGSIDTNYYLLAITSANRLSPQLAPNSGINATGDRCTSRYEEVGVQFRLVPIVHESLSESLTALSRSEVAHLCFGTKRLLNSLADPVRLPDRYGLEDAMRLQYRENNQYGLSDCDVPLAIFYYQNRQIQFIDTWSVRRLCQPGTRSLSFPSNGANFFRQERFTPLVSPRRVAEATAFFLQFQTQVEDLQARGDSAEISAEKYFQYLPPAGYLPIGSGAFNAKRFFGRDLPVYVYDDPALMRSLIHQSFHQEPIKPSEAVTLYQFDQAPENAPYVLFVRHSPVARLDETPVFDTRRTGTVFVTVRDIKGNPVVSGLVTSVQAVNKQTGEATIAKLARPSLTDVLTSREIYEKANEYSLGLKKEYETIKNFAQPIKVIDVESEKRDAAIKAFLDQANAQTAQPSETVEANNMLYKLSLPEGKYTVSANLSSKKSILLTSPSKSVTVVADKRQTIGLQVRPTLTRDPKFKGKITLKGKEVLERTVLESLYPYPEYKDFVPDWEERAEKIKEMAGMKPDLEVWKKIENPEITIQAEDILQRRLTDSTIPTANPEIYVYRNYDPSVPTEGVKAFLLTQDGIRIPAIVVAADNALNTPAATAQVPLPDFDQNTVRQLEAGGLGKLDMFASAPVELISAVLGQTPEYSKSLVEETRGYLEVGFQKGYLGFAGINDTEVNKSLTENFGSRVELANASAQEVKAVLGDGFSENYIERLLQSVRQAVPTASVSLPEEIRGVLKDRGIETLGQLVKAADDDAVRESLKSDLGDDQAILDYRNEALVEIAKGEFLDAPEKSLSTLNDITEDELKVLTAQGLVSAKDLASRDITDLSEKTGLSADKTAQLVKTASSAASDAHLTLAKGLLQGEVTTERLEGLGVFSLGSITNLSTQIVEGNEDARVLESVKPKLVEILPGTRLGRRLL